MQLRQKFSLVVLVYVVSLAVNLIMSAWCITVYFRSAFIEFESGLAAEQKVERARALIRQQRRLLEEEPAGSQLAADYRDGQEELAAILSSLEEDANDDAVAAVWSKIHKATARKDEAARRRLSQLGNSGSSSSPATMPSSDLGSFADLDRLLGSVAVLASQKRHENVAHVAGVQEQIVWILAVNAACGAILCVVGAMFVRRWVMRPVAALREAARRFARGDLSYRIHIRSRDELGKLANEVNQMASTITDMQSKLVEQERLAAAGEMFTRIAHNIRNPLAGMRGLAEATAQRHADDPETAECQNRIIETIDRFEKWLRRVQQSVSPMTLNLQPARVDELIGNVAAVLRPMMDRRRIGLQVDIDPRISKVRIDAMHVEQALAALLTNAVQASAADQSVCVSVRALPETPGLWELAVEDHGTGIPADLQQRIFTPYFTTKPDGNGVGLTIANKVITTHGGRLAMESEHGRGSRFVMTLPGLIEVEEE